MEIAKGFDYDDVRAEEIAIGVDRCLDGGQQGAATYLMTLIRNRSQSITTFAPQEIRLRYEMGNSAAVDRLFRALLLYRSKGVIGPRLQVEIAEAFAKAGDSRRAGVIFEYFHRNFQNPASPSNDFLDSYLHFLAQEGQYYKAQEVLRQACRKSPAPDMSLLVELYETWGRLDELSGVAVTFDLTSGSVVDLKRQLAARQEAKESLSDPPIPE